MANRFFDPVPQALNGVGTSLADAKLFFFKAGTSTPEDTFSDNALTSANANPVVADGDGRFSDIFLKAANYKVQLKTTAGVQIWERDPVNGSTPSDFIETIALLKAVQSADLVNNQVAYVTGYYAAGDIGDVTSIYKWVSSSSATDDLGVTIIPDDSSGNGRWILQNLQNDRQYGTKGDDGTAEKTRIQNFFNNGGELLLKTGINRIVAPVALPSNTTLTFEAGSVIKATSGASHVLGLGSDGVENVTIINAEVDGNSVLGLNGIGLSSTTATHAKNINLIAPVIRNCLRSPTTSGGRGLTFQNGVESGTVTNPKVYDCTTGYDMNGDTIASGSGGQNPVLGILITNAYVEGCQEAISMFSDGTTTNGSNPPTQPDSVQYTINNIFVRNCGRTTDTTLYSGGGTADDQDGGVVVSRRGRNVQINNMTVFNDNTYTIGGLFRGTGNNISINGFNMWGKVEAVVVVGSAQNLLPSSDANDPSYGLNISGRFHSTATNIVDVRIATATNYITSCIFDIEVDQFNSANAILLTASNFRDDSFIILTDLVTMKKISGNLLRVQSDNNTLATASDKITHCVAMEFTRNIVTGANCRVDYSTTSGGAGSSAGFFQVAVGGVNKKVEYFDI